MYRFPEPAQHEELGQLTDIVAQDRPGVADDVLVVVDGHPGAVGRGREVLEQGLSPQPLRLADRGVRRVERIGRAETSIDLGEGVEEDIEHGPRVGRDRGSVPDGHPRSLRRRVSAVITGDARVVRSQAWRTYADLIGGSPRWVAYTRS